VCSIDNGFYPCSRAAPNIVSIASTFTFLANTQHYLQVCPLSPTKLDNFDQELIHFKIFTLSGGYIIMGSHEHLSEMYSLTSLPQFSPILLSWSEPNFNVSWVYHIVYIGYYVNPIFLSPFNISIFT
jgi:hypothetical protein